MYQVLLFKFRRCLCKGSILLGGNLYYVVVVVADAGHSLVGCTGARELRNCRWVKNVTIKA